MSSNELLISHGLQVWVTDSARHNYTVEGTSVDVDTGIVSAVITIKPKTNYSVDWAICPGAQFLTAQCEVLVAEELEGDLLHWKSASKVFMDEQGYWTQKRSSKNHLLGSFSSNVLLRVPDQPLANNAHSLGAVRLELRRARLNRRLIDDAKYGLPPWIIFQFELRSPAASLGNYHEIITRARNARPRRSSSTFIPLTRRITVKSENDTDKKNSSLSPLTLIPSSPRSPSPANKCPSSSKVQVIRSAPVPSLGKRLQSNSSIPALEPSSKRLRTELKIRKPSPSESPTEMLEKIRALTEEEKHLARKLALRLKEKEESVSAMKKCLEQLG